MPVLDGRDPRAAHEAARRIAAGELVAFATETVYGLGARADDDAAVARVYAAKGRPSGHPLIVHVADAEAAAWFADGFHTDALKLAEAFWPGPLTVIVARRPGRAGAAAGAGLPTIGLRVPRHPVATALLRHAGALGVPGIAAPSANRFGRISPTHAEHVQHDFGEALAVLDGGACSVGVESAIVDCSAGRAALLRPGQIGVAELEAVLGYRLKDPGADAPRAPGTLAAHYAPRAVVRLWSSAALHAVLHARTADRATAAAAADPEDAAAGKVDQGLAVYSRLVPPGGSRVSHHAMPGDAAAAAHELFAALRAIDGTGVAQIWVEEPPLEPAWAAVRDRLSRAAAAPPAAEKGADG